MSLVKVISGFLIGAGVGVAVLVVISLNVPQFQGSNMDDMADVTTMTAPESAEPAAEEVAKIKESEPAVEAEAEPEVATATPEPEVVPEAVAEPALPKIVMQSEETDADKADNKIKLPTIEASEPVEEPSVVAVPVEDTGITIGEKPKSSLPSITEETPEATDETAADAASAGKALEFNATEYTATDRPMFGVILLDIGDKGLSVETLEKLNVPITIAILSDDPDASTRALAFHAAGFEVIAMVSDDRNDPLGTALNSGQINDALDVMFNTVPNAIGLLDSAQAKIQKNSRTSKAIVKNFVGSGHGLITYTQGLNSVDREARAAGIRTAKVARTLDANRENKAMITRYLDRAALDAGRDGAVIILGTTAKQTVAAIAVWLLGGKGQSVSLAPASAVLLQ